MKVQEDSRAAAAFLDIVLARLDLTPRNDNNVLGVERGDYIFPCCNSLETRIKGLLGTGKHVALNFVE